MCIRDRCSIFEPQVVSTLGILIARSLVKPDETGNVPIRVANILDQAITLQSNTLLGKLTPVAWITGMTPAKLVFGREIRLPWDLMFGSPETQSQKPKNYSSQLENQLREMNRLISCLLYTSRCV